MSSVSSSIGSGTAASTSDAASKSFQDIDVNQFLKLMIAELQNQDPLNPMDNAQMMQQLSQIREIAATDKLTSTLDSLLVGQNLATASSMIGKSIRAENDGQVVQGEVQSVSVEDGAGGARTLNVQVEGAATGVTSADDVASRVQLTAKQTGAAWNGVALAFINDNSIEPGLEQAMFDNSNPSQRAVVVRVRDGQSTAADVVAAINASAATSPYFNASLVGSSSGNGTVSVEDAALTAAGGRQSIPLSSVKEVFPVGQ